MNTSAVAKMLGVSPSTIQRWVKQANLQMERTELGHYQFSPESIEVLKEIKKQLNNGILLQDLNLKGRKVRKAEVVTKAKDERYEELERRIDWLERKLERKADEVVAYQILQHRRELEDIQLEVKRLVEVIKGFEQAAAESEISQDMNKKDGFMEAPAIRKIKKRNFINSFFGF